jgi:hypothetical protein
LGPIPNPHFELKIIISSKLLFKIMKIIIKIINYKL